MRLLLRRFPVPGGLLLFALLCATALLGAQHFRPHAATIVVTNTNDSGPGSLRAAIVAASDGDTIQFDAALNGQTITLTSGELAINKNITITGPGPSLLAVSKSGPSQFRIFHALSGHTVVVEGLTITGGDVHDSAGCGGGILNDGATSTINNCTISGNRGFDGGGICSENGSLAIANSSIDSNQAGAGSSGGSGGGIYHSGGSLELIQSTVTNNTGINYGGGVMSAGGTITIIDSTIRSNTTLLGGGIEIGGFFGGTGDVRNSTINSNTAQAGGGIGTSPGAGLTISNSTLSGNFANIAGGGISNSDALTITYSTITGNGTNGQGGGIYNGSSGTFEVGNTILNSGANIFNNGGGTITSHGYNLSSDNGGGFLTATGDQINTNPMLGPLQNNGGPTFTHTLLADSPAIDAGDPNFTPPPLYDQRGVGYDRGSNGRIDIGSFEVQVAPTPSPTPTATPSCPPVITQSTSQAITTPCPACFHPPPMYFPHPNAYWRAFNMQSFVGGAEFTVSSVSFGVFSVGGGDGTVTVELYANNGAPFPAERGTLIGTSTLTVTPGQGGTIVTTPLAAIVPAGTIQLVMEVYVPEGGPSGPNVGANTAPESGPSYWSSIDKASACSSTPQVIASHLVFNIYGTCSAPAPTATPTPTPTPCSSAGPGPAMSGNVSYCSNPVPAPVPGVTILVGNLPWVTTDSSGHYSIFFKAGCNCIVTPSNADRTPGSPGINTVDAVAVERHFLIIGTPLSGCRLTAADVNGDASINTIDVIAIQRFFLGFSTGIANVGKYQFNPHSRCYTSGPNQDFDTLVFGDVAPPFIY